VVGDVVVQLRDGMLKEYLDVPLSMSLKGWTTKWFYIGNPPPSTSSEIDYLAEPNEN
jgi:hypothetical protein